MMNLKVLLPFGIFIHEHAVQSIVVETEDGSFGLLPQRLDCVAAITPGILSYRGSANAETVIAVDAGVIVKTGLQVTISVRHAIVGNDLNLLRDAVEQAFIQESTQDKKVHSVFQKMESDFVSRLSVFHHEK